MKSAIINTNDFNRMISATKQFVASTPAHKIRQYIKLEFRAQMSQVIAVAVDGYRMSVEHAIISDCDEDFTAYIKGNVRLPKSKFAKFELNENDNEILIRCHDFVFGYQQPDGEFLDWENAIPRNEVQYKIAFNGDYLLSALQAAKISVGDCFRQPVILEFRGSNEPIILRTNKEDIKMVLPVRIKED